MLIKPKLKQWNISENVGRKINTGSNDSILAALFQDMLDKMNIRMHGFSVLLDRFVADPRNCIPVNIKERASARGNLRKELMKSTMTWNVFCKGVRFLNVKRFRITVDLYHVNGDITTHSQIVNTGDVEMIEETVKETHDSNGQLDTSEKSGE